MYPPHVLGLGSLGNEIACNVQQSRIRRYVGQDKGPLIPQRRSEVRGYQEKHRWVPGEVGSVGSPTGRRNLLVQGISECGVCF